MPGMQVSGRRMEMKREKRTWHSPALDKDMTVIVYGEGGVPMLGFPTQDSMASNWEDLA